MLLSVDDICCGQGEDIKTMVSLRSQRARGVKRELDYSVSKTCSNVAKK